MTVKTKTTLANLVNEFLCLAIMALTGFLVLYVHAIAMNNVPMELIPRLLSAFVAISVWSILSAGTIRGVCGNLSTNWERWIKH